jgi:hypothetical protein
LPQKLAPPRKPVYSGGYRGWEQTITRAGKISLT